MLNADLRKQLRDFYLDISLSVNPGEVLILLGENGSGKSTSLNLLAGLQNPDNGRIVLNGKTLFCKTSMVTIPPEERNIGYVFQNYALFPHLSTFENVAFGLKMRKLPKEQIQKQVHNMLQELDIDQFRDKKVTELSGGQQQRVALARALIMKPHLLLLDEPLTALDQKTRIKLRLELRKYLVKSNKPTILVTHSKKDARIIGDRVMMIERGKVIWTGSAEAIDKNFEGEIPSFNNEA